MSENEFFLEVKHDGITSFIDFKCWDGSIVSKTFMQFVNFQGPLAAGVIFQLLLSRHEWGRPKNELSQLS